jgi:thiamine biosynthesis protein ThiI
MNCILVHYSEIGLKGGNRDFFEKKLVSNIKTALSDFKPFVKRLSGRIMVIHEGDESKIEERLRKVPGIASFSFALEAGRDMDEMKKALDVLASGKRKEKIKTFAVSCVRSDKGFGHTSKEMNEIFGDYLRKKYKWKVNLSNPESTFFVEVTQKQAFVHTEKINGIGGLPVTSGGKLVSLLSGGIDSPVAAREMFKRGCSIVFVHFHNWTSQKDVVKDKVERIVKVLSGYQPKTRLYMVPFEELQKSLLMKVPSELRMIVYRRIMFKIAWVIAEKEKALGFVTGDSVGQVASQTLENLSCIYDNVRCPVFTPLAGANKEEIIAKAKAIGTYDLSILPYSDCCSFLVAKHPETRAKLDVIEKVESGIDIDALSKKALEAAGIKDF